MILDPETAAMLTDAVSSFAKPDQDAARALRDSGAGFDRDAWRTMGQQAWLGVAASEDAGGMGLGALGAIAIARPLGYALRSEPFAAAVQAGACLEAGTGKGVFVSLAEKLFSGEVVVTVAAPVDLSDVAVTAEPDGDGFRLTGTVAFAELAGQDSRIVAASGPDGPGLFLIPQRAQGVVQTPLRAPDGFPVSRLDFKDAWVPADHVLCIGVKAKIVARRAGDLALIVQSAELLGLIDRVLEFTLEYLRTRKQFGRPIGSFQILQHRAVDLWIQRELTEAAVRAAAAAFDTPGLDVNHRSSLASASKARAASAAMMVCNQSIQLHGAIGITDEYELSLHLNRALRISNTLGNSFEHRRRFAHHAARAAIEDPDQEAAA